MTGWHSKTTLQKLLDLAGLHCTTSERPGLTQHAAQLLVQALLISFSFQQHDWSRANLKGPVSHLSLSPCTGSRLQLVSSLRHWCLHIEQPQAQHRLRTLLLPLPYNNLHPFQKSEICERGSPRGSITERDKITLQSYPPPPVFTTIFDSQYRQELFVGGVNEWRSFPPSIISFISTARHIFCYVVYTSTYCIANNIVYI